MTGISDFQLKVLALLQDDARLKPEVMATMLAVTVEDVKAAITALEKDNVIIKYATIVNWSKLHDEKVTALIEVQITPERGRGFDRIAESIYLYPEVKSLYLMSGAYDLQVEIEGQSLKEVASFVSNKLSTIDAVLSTKTYFILKKYKQDGIIFEESESDPRMMVSP